MKLFIFGIGGSGSRVVRSLSMLMASGVSHFKTGDQVFPLMIDYDTKNGDTKRAFECVKTYNILHNCAFPKQLSQTAETDRRFFHTPIMQMSDIGDNFHSTFAMQFRQNENDKTFGDAIAYRNLNDKKSKTKDLLDSLYDVSNGEDTELNIDMTVGFKGNPNIGSVVFNGLKDSNELKEFFLCCSPEAGDKVILIGSLFGGTGASGIPEITKAIRNNRKTKDVHLGVVMLLPYFGFDAADEKGTVRSKLFDTKTRAALSYYESSGVNNMIDSIYYIGDKERTKMEYCLGAESQKNNSHIVDLIGALSVLHFFKTDRAPGGVVQRYKYRMHDNAPDATPGFTILNFYKDDYRDVIMSLVKFAFALKFFNNEIAKMNYKSVKKHAYSQAFNLPFYFDREGRVDDTIKGVGDASKGSESKYEPGLHSTLYNFQEFSKKFLEWIDELTKIGNHSLMMFDFDAEMYKLVRDCELLKTEKGTFGGTSETKLVNATDFGAAIQAHYAKQYQNAAPTGDLRFNGTTAGYAFLDCLLNGVETILDRPDVKQILKFN